MSSLAFDNFFVPFYCERNWDVAIDNIQQNPQAWATMFRGPKSECRAVWRRWTHVGGSLSKPRSPSEHLGVYCILFSIFHYISSVKVTFAGINIQLKYPPLPSERSLEFS